jgi:kinetochore protein NDC80
MSDKTKFISFIDSLSQKSEKLVANNARARAAVVDTGTSSPSTVVICARADPHAEEQIQAIRAELVRTEAAVAAQNLSPDEVNRMNHERETLTRNLDELRNKIAEASQSSYDQELQVTRSMDRFDQLLQDYNALGSQIGTIPLDRTSGPGGVEYVLELELGQEDLSELQAVGQRMKLEIRPGLHAFAEGFISQVRDLQDRIIAQDDELDRLGQKVERQKEEMGVQELRLKAVLQNAEEAKAVSRVLLIGICLG